MIYRFNDLTANGHWSNKREPPIGIACRTRYNVSFALNHSVLDYIGTSQIHCDYGHKVTHVSLTISHHVYKNLSIIYKPQIQAQIDRRNTDGIPLWTQERP